MSDNVPEEKSTEEQNVKIDAIDAGDALGVEKPGRGEHSGQSAEPAKSDLKGVLADNRPDQVK